MVESRTRFTVIQGGLNSESPLGTNIRLHPTRIAKDAMEALDRSMDLIERAANRTDADDITHMRNLWFERHPEYDKYLDSTPSTEPDVPPPPTSA